MNIITYVGGENWRGVYVNGTLYHEDHNISGECMALILHKFQPFERFTKKNVDQDWMDDRVNLPKDLKDVKFEED